MTRQGTPWRAAVRLLTLAATIAASAGCARYDTAALRGEWRATYPFGTDTVTLRADGTYEQRFVLKSTGKTTYRSGTWEYNQQTKRVVVHGYMPVLEGFEQLQPNYETARVAWVTVPERQHLLFGKLVLDGAGPYPYVKQ